MKVKAIFAFILVVVLVAFAAIVHAQQQGSLTIDGNVVTYQGPPNAIGYEVWFCDGDYQHFYFPPDELPVPGFVVEFDTRISRAEVYDESEQLIIAGVQSCHPTSTPTATTVPSTATPTHTPLPTYTPTSTFTPVPPTKEPEPDPTPLNVFLPKIDRNKTWLQLCSDGNPPEGWPCIPVEPNPGG